jgi:tRNA uridine 5-carbamoylmethylation protein Kti12
MEQTLSQIIQTLVKVRGENKLSISDECLFDNAVKMFISNTIQESRVITKPSSEEPKIRFSPTPKQLKILKQAGLKEEVIKEMSKQEVSQVIGEYLNSLKKENI